MDVDYFVHLYHKNSAQFCIETHNADCILSTPVTELNRKQLETVGRRKLMLHALVAWGKPLRQCFFLMQTIQSMGSITYWGIYDQALYQLKCIFRFRIHFHFLFTSTASIKMTKKTKFERTYNLFGWHYFFFMYISNWLCQINQKRKCFHFAYRRRSPSNRIEHCCATQFSLMFAIYVLFVGFIICVFSALVNYGLW